MVKMASGATSLRRFLPRSPHVFGVAFLIAGSLTAIFAIRSLEHLKPPETDYGQHLGRHMRYTFAEVAAIDSMLGALEVSENKQNALDLIQKTADRFYVRLENLSGLKTGPLSNPAGPINLTANALMEQLDKIVVAGVPLNPGALNEAKTLSHSLLQETGDFTRQVELDVDRMLRHRRKLASAVSFEVAFSIFLLLILAMLTFGLFLYNRRIVRKLQISNGQDSLTDLSNRRGFTDWIGQKVLDEPDTQFAFLLFDVDRFKAINDNFGHFTGDRILKHTAAHLRLFFGVEGHVARWGGDEFVAVVRLRSEGTAALEHKLIKLISRPPELPMDGGGTMPVGLSCGVSLWPQDAETVDEAVSRADAALLEAKRNGRGRFAFYHDDLSEKQRRQDAIRSDLKRAIADGEFFLVYQPQFCVRSNKIVCAEALIRWRSSRTGTIIRPDEFIAVAEESQHIWSIDTFVLNTACRAAAHWVNMPNGLDRIAINLSPHSFQRVGLGAHVEAILRRWNMPANKLELEITEGVLLSESPQLNENLAALKALGIRLALDDFGTGYSNVAYLARLRPDLLKIDRSFLREPNDHMRKSIIQGVSRISSSIGATTLVEGVETQADLDFVRESGCSLVQGYLLAYPMPEDELQALLVKTNQPDAALPATP
ncbi:bifunctional diguanylate cyclase/phosphodiesterase [Roseibium sp. CAU 1637]|uniref:Bifunctional diguanylate cyclase/phosphodiesterase n=1 Tax=Roseibium limicola TaxID=2816037 RepID=A0A939EMD9_9HYPH|nr:bifunctional diguanylate cyclase/phosphodiesterase [Roseibium limicola]MBO0345103.1 bifunctional diguanylate cyclase/phosphodiesterase [Roseibium limicola]